MTRRAFNYSHLDHLTIPELRKKVNDLNDLANRLSGRVRVMDVLRPSGAHPLDQMDLASTNAELTYATNLLRQRCRKDPTQ